MSKLGKTTDSAYNQLPQVRNSDLGKILKSWNHFKSEEIKEDQEESKALLFGRAFHAFLLEESVFWENNAILPEGLDRRTKEGKATYEALTSSGKNLVSHSDYSTFQKMKDSLMAHPMAVNILSKSENEGAYTGVLEGVEVKCKIDLINKGYIFDVKTTDDASPEGFRRSIGKWNYERQAAFYSDIASQNDLEVKGFVFVAVEKKAPFNVGVYMLELDSVELGRNDYKKALAKFKTHTENPTTFSGYSPEIMPISSPNWRFMESAVGA